MRTGGFSRTTLFLMEQLIALTVLALCSAVCVRLFAESYAVAAENAQTRGALIAVQSGAEVYKAYSGEAALVAAQLGGVQVDGTIEVYLDAAWQPCAQQSARYLLRVACRPADTAGLKLADITAGRIGGEEILRLSVYAGGAQHE